MVSNAPPIVESDQITTMCHHAFHWNGEDLDWLAEHLQDLEVEGYRVVSVTPKDDEFFFVMARPDAHA